MIGFTHMDIFNGNKVGDGVTEKIYLLYKM